MRVLLTDFAEIKVSKNVQSMIHTDDHDIMFRGKIVSVIKRERRGTVRIATAMQPDHDRTLAIVFDSGRPDIQNEAILAHVSVPFHNRGFRNQTATRRADLRCPGTVFDGFLHVLPGLRLHWRHESSGARCRCAVWNSFEGVRLVLKDALNLAGGRFNDRILTQERQSAAHQKACRSRGLKKE